MNEKIYVNGINGMTGEYLIPPMSIEEAVAMARGKPQDSRLSGWLNRIVEVMKRRFLDLPLGVEPTNISQAGWGVVFPTNIAPEIRSALEPLMAHRRSRVFPDRWKGVDKVFDKALEYKPGEAVRDWLKRYNVDVGSVKPTKVPYYLLLVGDPTGIPFDFQYLLGTEYAVGRLAFDTAEQYRQYAESVVAYETAGTVPNVKEVVYWATRHNGDIATQMSANHLITPLYEGLPDSAEEALPVAMEHSYRQRCLKEKDATKANLLDVFASPGANQPALVVTASHGIGGWPKEEAAQQKALHGALLCQDWLGVGLGAVKPQHYLTGAEIPDTARVHGLVAFLFACFGAGTPQYDHFQKDRSRGPVQIAAQPFVAALPQRLLSHPNGSALAVISHVDRALGYSFVPDAKVGPQLIPFRNCLYGILNGDPVGHTTKSISHRYASLYANLGQMLDETQPGPRPSDVDLVKTWSECHDAQNYIMLGDPAVQLRVDLLK